MLNFSGINKKSLEDTHAHGFFLIELKILLFHYHGVRTRVHYLLVELFLFSHLERGSSSTLSIRKNVSNNFF